MKKLYLGLGTNLGDRRQNLELALQKISIALKPSPLRCSSIYETPAMLPELAPAEWNRPFWNIVIETEFSDAPLELLSLLKKIEQEMGRQSGKRWAPRIIDLDILFWEGVDLNDPTLKIPHPGIYDRSFVLTPLSELRPKLILSPGKSAYAYTSQPKNHLPRLMGILNVTPDSFSDGGKNRTVDQVCTTLSQWDELGISVIDLGAESTRPGATPITAAEEWTRLEPVLQAIQDRYSGKFLKPKISLDTHRAETATRACAYGIDLINDVGALQDPKMREVVANHSGQVVLMHSLSVPADPKQILREDESVMSHLTEWFEKRIEELTREGIKKDRLLLDPGIGFGKNSVQSLEILKSVESLRSLECPLLVGHSRKSFFNDLSSWAPSTRDPETLGVSLALVSKAVDLIRVHDPILHHRAFLAWRHVQ